MRLKKLDKIRLLVLLPLSLAFIVFGSIVYANAQNDEVNNNELLIKNQQSIATLQEEIKQITEPKIDETTTVSPTKRIDTTTREVAGVEDEANMPDDGDETDPECQPMLEYCDPPGANLLDDVYFNQSNDGSFENPICTLNPDGSFGGKGCDAVGQQQTYYQADRSALLPINSMAFFTSGTGYDKPEYIPQEVAGNQQCEEGLTAHGNNSYKIFSRQGFALKGGLCLPMKPHGNPTHSGINFRVSQATRNISDNVEVVFRLGYITSPIANNFYTDSTPSLHESSITWVTSRTVGQSEYGQEEGFASRYAGGFLESTIPGNATGFCFMAESAGGVGINTFWDAAFASIDSNSCDIASEHKDGIDRSCGGYVCGDVEPEITGNNYVDFNQEYYPLEMPANWRATQCHYETETNGADSEYGTVYAGLDLNNCDPNYFDPAQRNLHPEMDKPDVACSSLRNWIYGYAWIGGIKDFGLLQYLDCALTGEFKGTESNPFFCDQILKSYANTIDLVNEDDPAFTIRYSNTYSGLVNAIQGEGGSNFWKVPLLGSAVSSGLINHRQVSDLVIDPYLISKRNSGSGLNNFLKFNLEDTMISEILRREEHLYEESIIPNNEVLVEDLLANGPVCADIEGDPVTKIHYGPENGVSDRAVFGFADDEGSFEHIIHAENNDISPETLCNFQFREDRVVGATCTFNNIGEGRSVTFTEDNIGNTLEQEGYVSRLTRPTLLGPTGIPDDNFETCQGAKLCGVDWGCDATMRQLYDACIGDGTAETVDAVGGNPFIRHVQPDPWRDLQVFGLSKVMDSSWHNEFIQYNMPVRHENVGLDVNQVISLYDQQQPKCSIMPESRRPVYCTNDSALNKAQQVCRRVPPYNCNCGPTNFTTCLLECEHNFMPPPPLEDIGLPIEGSVAPTLPPDSNEDQPLDTAIRPILDNSRRSFLEKFVRLLEPKTYPGEGAQDYEEGQIFNYDPRYTGGFLLANTGGEATQCTVQTGPRAAESVSQVRIENYFAYAGQLARINERIGFAATNNKDPETVDQLTIDVEVATIAEFEEFIERGGQAKEYIALPYCDLLTYEDKSNCLATTGESCDCLIRSCQQQLDHKTMILEQYVGDFCDLLYTEINSGGVVNEGIRYLFSAPGCEANLKKGYKERRFQPAYETCIATPKTNLNYNCDPMANYLISQGFASAELNFAACDEIVNDQQCEYDKFGVHLITGPVQQDNYTRAENLGLEWKMEVIVDDSPEMVNAMVESVNSFSGKTIFRFCNADQGEPGSKIQDPSCQFRTELTGSPAESGRKAADMILRVAERTSKPFLVSPINEPVSEHWFGGDLNDDSNPNTMRAVSEFYTAFADILNGNQALRSKIEIGGPTYNVTAFGYYTNFEKFHSEFSAKDVVDYWTINIYNHNDLPSTINKLEIQYEHTKTIFNDGKPIGINETGDFQHDINRLRESFTEIGSDSRLKYALLFNAFGGWGDDRGAPLVLNDTEIRSVLSENGVCEDDDGGGNNICVEGGILGLLKAVTDSINASSPQIAPEMLYGLGINEGFGGGLSGDPNEVQQANATLGNDANNDRQINPPCTRAYTETDKDEIFAKYGCEYDVRGVMQFQNFTFYNTIISNRALMVACTDAIGVDYSIGSDDPGLDAVFEANGQSAADNIFSRARVGDNLCAAAIFVGNIGRSENGGSNITPAEWRSLALAYTTGDQSNTIFQVAARYYGANDSCSGNAYCNNVTLDTKEAFENGIFDDISSECAPTPTSPECLVSPIDNPYITQCFGNTLIPDSSNAYCLQTFKLAERNSPRFNEYGLTEMYYSSVGHYHTGIDAVKVGEPNTPIYSAGPGVVTQVFDTYYDDPDDGKFPYGNYLVVEHKLTVGGSVYTRYAHMESIDVEIGDTVDNTTQLGLMGTTGNSTGEHLHFEYLTNIPPNTSRVFTTKETATDPTDIFLRSRINPPSECSIPEDPPIDTGGIVIGQSAGGNNIVYYKFGNGAENILLAGGVHGGYEWNSILLAYKAIDYFTENPDAIPDNISLYIIPNVNPDGLKKIIGKTGRFTIADVPNRPRPENIAGRYNDNNVDINRNFDCNWKADAAGPGGAIIEGIGGTKAFSEPESIVLRNFINAYKPKASVFYHSVGGFISAGSADCSLNYYAPGIELANTYGQYEVIEAGNPFTYEITGDITDWMAKNSLTGINVELSSAEGTEWERNLMGIQNLLENYGE